MGCTRPPNCSQMRLTRPVHSRGTGLYFNGNFLTMRPSGKSHLPCSSWVANIDFKLCCSLADGHKLHWKVESSSSKATIVRIGAESLKIFPSLPEKGINGLSFAKSRAADSNFGKKTASRSRSFGTAVSTLDFVYRKLRHRPEPPPPDEIDQMENRNQAR